MGKKQERRPKKRSAAQRAQSSTMRNGNKENEQPVPVATPAQQKPRDYKTAFENSQRRVRRMDVKEAKHKSVVLDLKKQLKAEQKAREAAVRSLENAAKRAAQIAAEREHRILVVHEKLLGAQRLTSDVQRENRALGKRVQRASGVLQRAIARTKAKPFTTQLMRRGMYTIHARQMAREIAGAGAAREKVGPLMTKIAKIFGVKIDKQRSMSRRTVSRSILEGGIAARMQLTHELSSNEGVTISADSTSHRGNNYESAKFQHRVPDYQKNPHYIDPTSTPRIRHAGVDSTLDHSSEKAVAGWKHRVESNAKVYNESPLAARLGKHFTIRHFLRTLKGMNGDHASVEKGTANGIGGWKHDEGVNELGEDALVSMSIADLVVYLQEWNAKKIANVGGVAAWEALSPTEQAVHDKRLMTEVVEALGQEEYDALGEADKRTLDLFIWAGCCMHKDQNSFSGGNTEMLSEWERIGAPAPRLLVNKANSIAIQRLLEPGAKIPDTLTDLEQKALEDSTRGGVKLCAIAGAILKNKDSKKGQGDKHTDFMTYRVGKYHIRFPDTSNTRFGSYGLAAAELIKYLDVYRELMEVIEFSKTRPGLTNIEKNLRDALGDMSTLTELCAMILYQQIITHPYIRVVRGPGAEATNALDLGPLHADVRKHIEHIIENPDLVISADISYLTASLDGQEWQDPAAVEAVIKLMPTLPHLKDIVVAFFRGALATWIRERQLAWMPPTNDANEGALGQLRVILRNHPTLTLHQFNAAVMFNQNNTQDFMDAVFEMPDHLYIMRLARAEDASGIEKKRKSELAEFRIRLSTMRKEKEIAKRQKEIEDLRILVKVKLVSTVAKIYAAGREANLTVKMLHQQLDAFRLRGVPDIKSNSTYPRKADKQAALECALKKFQISPESYPIPAAVLAKISNPVVRPETQILVDWAEGEEIEMEE
ncbi:hypothetical protein C8R47DRAFT_1048987 [Mycena vitilis]|nr:hypothetical protein C8R47DRAFT_1048987 [Mycena vitilis]